MKRIVELWLKSGNKLEVGVNCLEIVTNVSGIGWYYHVTFAGQNRMGTVEEDDVEMEVTESHGE